MSGTPGSPYAADALAANQAGRLTDQQRQAFRGQDKAFRKNELFGAVGAAIIGFLLITSSGGPSSNDWLRRVAAVAAFVIAAALLVRATVARDSLSSDLASGSVETVEGAVLKDTRSGKRDEWFYLNVAGKRFEVPHSVYQAAPEAGYVRVYFLPRSKTVVNLEHLADSTVAGRDGRVTGRHRPGRPRLVRFTRPEPAGRGDGPDGRAQGLHGTGPGPCGHAARPRCAGPEAAG